MRLYRHLLSNYIPKMFNFMALRIFKLAFSGIMYLLMDKFKRTSMTKKYQQCPKLA